MARFGAIVVAVVVALAGCTGASSTAPDSTGIVAVTVQPLATFAGDPTTAAFGLRIENLTDTDLDLTFPSSCRVLPYFVDRRTGQPVTPRGGGFACATVITRLSLPPSASVVEAITVTANENASSGFIGLPPGDYSIYARLEDQQHRVQSDLVPFTLR